ncbi:hypothetical protein Kisp01_04230 [Kineosporia sp. NBRC 101677]|nr:hypothetical protein Kisp01_04230 [Kineosporia sp. NBRC 101677]
MCPRGARVFAECNPIRVGDEAFLSQGLTAIWRHATSQFGHLSTSSYVNAVSLGRFRAVSEVNPVRAVPAKRCGV